MHDEPITRNQGFSLLELTCAMALLLIVGGTALYALAVYQRTYSGNAVRQNMQSSVRTATELLQQEIGQAGAFTGVGGASTVTITAPVSISPSATAQSVTLTSTTGMFVGENLQVDLGTNQETVAITSITGSTIKAVFTNSHTPPTVVNLAGIIPFGVMYGQTVGVPTSDGTHLYLIGDLNSDGNLYYAAYTCTQSNTPPNFGTLTRSIKLLPATTLAAADTDTLVQNVTTNPDGSACFQYQTTSVTVFGATYTVVTGVGLTLSTSSSQPDPQIPHTSGAAWPSGYLTVTNSFLNLSPRNILYGVNLATAGSSNGLQSLPPTSYYP